MRRTSVPVGGLFFFLRGSKMASEDEEVEINMNKKRKKKSARSVSERGLASINYAITTTETNPDFFVTLRINIPRTPPVITQNS